MEEEDGHGKVVVKRRALALEDEIYWTNFKCMRFFLPLKGDFLNHLMIPKKFSEMLGDKLPQTLVLKGPGGATSVVRLLKDNQGTLLLKDGWKEFATAHKFLRSDVLMFKYKRDSCFKVTVFDRRTLCENASSYFVRKCSSQNKSTALNSRPKIEARESSVVVPVAKEDSEFQCSDSEMTNTAGSSRRKGHKQTSFVFKKRSEAELKPPSTPIPYISTRRLLSEGEKSRALRLAISESTKDSFLVVMKSSHVSSKHNRFCIPVGWARKHLSCKNKEVVLRVNEKKWIMRFSFYNKSGSRVIGKGWNKFVRDNSLREEDVCLCALSTRKDEPAIIDVRIFYAREEVVNQTF